MTIGQQFIYIPNRVIGSNGLAVGASIYFYLTGTTTKIDVFTDASLSTPAANPTVVNAGAAVPDRYWDTSLTVRVRVVSVTGEVISDEDPWEGFSAATLTFLQGGIGAVASSVQTQLRFFIRPEQFGAVGDGTTDDTAAIQRALDYAEETGATVLLAATTYKTTDTLNVPAAVSVYGSGYNFATGGYNPGPNRACGSQIYKAHGNNAIEIIATDDFTPSAGIWGVTVSSNYVTWPTGSAFVMDKCSSYNVEFCQAWSIGGDGFVMGVTAGDVNPHVYLGRCYTNNVQGKSYVMHSKWFRMFNCLSDNGTHGLYVDTASDGHIIDCHFEGFTTCGVEFAGGAQSTRFVGFNLINNTANAPDCVKVDNTAGNALLDLSDAKIIGFSTQTSITFTGSLSGATSGTLNAAWSGTTGSYGIYFSDGSVKTATLTNGNTAVSWTGAVTASASAVAMSAPTSIGINIAGSMAAVTLIRGCEINNVATGISNNGPDTIVEDCFFQYCGLPIRSNADYAIYNKNRQYLSASPYGIDHVSGGGGLWTGNRLGAPKPTATGVLGNYGTNTVKNNPDFKTAARGTTGVISSGTAVAHGLAATPNFATFQALSPFSQDVPQVGLDATNITPTFSGGGSAQFAWEAFVYCEAP